MSGSRTMRVVGSAIATALTACSFLVDTGDLAGGNAADSGIPDVATLEAGGSDAGGDAGAAPSEAGTTLMFDPGGAWPVSTPSTNLSQTTPTFTTSTGCTDLIVLANSGLGNASSSLATIASSTGMTFEEVVRETGNTGDAVYIWHATSPCAARSTSVTVTWTLGAGGTLLWGNVVVFAFTHSKGIGAKAHAHTPGNTSINVISITPVASGSWLFASLSGNGGKDATSAGTAGEYVQEFSLEGAVQSYGATQTPSATTLGVPVSFSMPLPDDVWANAAVEVMSL